MKKGSERVGKDIVARVLERGAVRANSRKEGCHSFEYGCLSDSILVNLSIFLEELRT